MKGLGLLGSTEERVVLSKVGEIRCDLRVAFGQRFFAHCQSSLEKRLSLGMTALPRVETAHDVECSGDERVPLGERCLQDRQCTPLQRLGLRVPLLRAIHQG